MNRKTIINLFSFSLLAALLSSCGSSNNVVSSLGKRKYTGGFYVNLPGANERVARISGKVVEPSMETNKTAEPEIVPVAETQKTEVEKSPKTEISIISSQAIKQIPVYENKKKTVVTTVKEIKPDNNKQISDSAEDEKKDKQFNRIIGVIGFTAAVAGAILLLMPSFIIAGICLAVGLVVSAIGIKRGSSSLLAFFGFIISALGVLALIDLFIVTNQ